MTAAVIYDYCRDTRRPSRAGHIITSRPFVQIVRGEYRLMRRNGTPASVARRAVSNLLFIGGSSAVRWDRKAGGES